MQFLLVSSGSRARNHFTFDSYLHVGGNRRAVDTLQIEFSFFRICPNGLPYPWEAAGHVCHVIRQVTLNTSNQIKLKNIAGRLSR
jgi:hypothetical protein